MSFTARYLSVLGSLSLGLGVTELEPVIKRMTKFRDESGLYRETLEEKKGESQRTFLMLEVIALSAGKIGASKGVKHTLEKALNLLPGGASELQSIVDATLLGPLARANPEPLDLSDSQLLAISQRLLVLVSTPSIATAYKALTGIQTIAKYPSAPASIFLPASQVRPGEPLVVEVRGLLGQALDDVTVTIERLTLPVRNEEKETYRGTTLNGVGNNQFHGEWDS